MVDIQKMMEMLFKIYMMESMKEIKKDNDISNQVDGLREFFKDNPLLRPLPMIPDPLMGQAPNSQEQDIIDKFKTNLSDSLRIRKINHKAIQLSSEERDMILATAKESEDYRCEVTKDGELTITTHIWTSPDGVKKQMTIIDANGVGPEDMKPRTKSTKIKNLQKELAYAIDKEDYEKAASLRDAISDLKNS